MSLELKDGLRCCDLFEKYELHSYIRSNMQKILAFKDEFLGENKTSMVLKKMKIFHSTNGAI